MPRQQRGQGLRRHERRDERLGRGVGVGVGQRSGTDAVDGADGGPGGAHVVIARPAVVRHLDELAECRRVDHHPAAEVEPDVVDPGRGAVEDQVTGQQRFAGLHVRAGVELGVRRPRQGDAGGDEGGVGEPGAVEARVPGVGPVAAPDVEQADLAERVADRHLRDRGRVDRGLRGENRVVVRGGEIGPGGRRRGRVRDAGGRGRHRLRHRCERRRQGDGAERGHAHPATGAARAAR